MSSQIKYPEIIFWNKEAEKIDFVNPEDFRKGKLLNILGLIRSKLQDSFGIVDRKEIIRRQGSIRFFIENPSLIEFFNHSNLDVTYLPTDGQNFLDYFNPKQKYNPFWQLVNDFTGRMTKHKEVPQEILSLVNFLKETKTDIRTEEHKMVDGIAKEVQKATYFEGAVDFGLEGELDPDFKIKDSEVYGYKKYSYGLSDKWKKLKIPYWADKKPWRWTGVNSFFDVCCKAYNRINARLFYTPLVIEETPRSVILAIENFIRSKIDIAAIPKSGYNSDVVIKFYFRYSEGGLQIKLLNVLTRIKDEEKINTFDFIKKEFPGYRYRELRQIKRRNREFSLQSDKIRKDLYSYRLVNLIEENIPGICDQLINIDSNQVDLKFKWYAVSTLYHDPIFQESYERIKEYRNYFRAHMHTLKAMAEVSEALIEKSKKWDKPLCFPEILEEDRHLVSFESLEPIHLIGETKLNTKKQLTVADLVSIVSLPSLNGQIIGFTGQNAGGKSAAEEAIVNAIFLAQSGLPVFGKNFTLNVKRKIGMVFLERGSGSTCELLLRKTKILLESLNGTGKNGIILVLDEVGTGTQEIDGFDYGKRLLKKLADFHCSVIFSTQITDLAKYATEELNAECFAFDLQHQVKPGIGRGGIEKLMTDIGIDKLLN